MRLLALRSSSELALVAVPDGAHERLVVLKRLPVALATDPAAVEKFRIEARLAALLDHPNIVRVHDVVETPADDFYTMEYVYGGNLRQVMEALHAQRKTMPLDCVLLIAIAMCDALDYAYHLTDDFGAPVIHRELSPSKVLLGVDGSVKLTGFAAPPARPGKLRRSRTGSIGYTSPERCLGETMDARSDLFALGVLLYELSSGERLFAETTPENQIMTRIIRGDLPRPSEVRRGYPRELEAILMRMLARDKKERFQSAGQLQASLESFLWSRWPTASTAALAKLVETTLPASELGAGTAENARIDAQEPVLWLGPVPLAKPFPKAGEQPRTSTRELKRLAPDKFPEASTSNVMLGRPGASARDERATTVDTRRPTVDDRATTVDELAIPIAGARDKATAVNANVLPPRSKKTQEVVILGTPGAKPSPLGGASERAKAFDAANDQQPRGQYQRPEALDEPAPRESRTPGALGRIAVARVVTPIGLVREEIVRPAKTATPPEPVTTVAAKHTDSIDIPFELDIDQAHTSWTLISTPAPDPIEAVKQRLPSPPPAAIAGRRWPLATIAAILCVVVLGVLASAYAIKRTTHVSSDLPEVLAAQPAPPTDLVVHVKRNENAVPAEPKAAPRAKRPPAAKKPDPKPLGAQAAPAPEPAPPKPPVDPRSSLFPPADEPTYDGIPYLVTLEVKGHVSEPAIRKVVGQTLAPLRACYRMASRQRQLAPQVDLSIAFEIDHRRVPTKVRAIGGGTLDALASCASKVTSELRDLPAPTTGTARISVALEFRPN